MHMCKCFVMDLLVKPFYMKLIKLLALKQISHECVQTLETNRFYLQINLFIQLYVKIATCQGSVTRSQGQYGHGLVSSEF